ncbi:MAG TPA: glycosyltransferase family 1 protein [Anaerolineae bacterium]|nr:glycosyltransferase family 1 protein [Anaerolineae bacterium]HMR62708.1 glycosyltransferase family 1 protein [Anaerolineae bacterium]
MHVCLDVSPAAQKHAGLGRYAAEVARALAEDGAVKLSLFYNREGQAELPADLDRLPQRTVNIGNKPWRMAVLLSQLSRRPMDRVFGATELFHATNHLLAHFKQARTVFTLHDLIFLHYPEYHMFYNRWYLTLAMPHFLRAADLIIVPSACTKRDAQKFYGLPEDKIKVIYEAAGPHFQPIRQAEAVDRVRRKYGLPERFLLHVGTIEPRKNLTRLLDAFHALLGEEPELRLVLVGKKGWLYESFFQRLQALGLQERVIFPGFVDEAELPAFYQLAQVFVYPSFYEGFGLPPLEAMSCGAAVVSSQAASLPEVVGEAGLMVDPADTGALTRALRRVLLDAELRRKLQKRSLEQAQRFSWAKAAQMLVEAYGSVSAQA